MHNEPDFIERIRSMAQGGDDPVLRKHVEHCEECQENLAIIEQLDRFRDLTGGELAEVSDAQIVQLTELFAKVRPDLALVAAPQPSVMDRIKTIFAELLHDTGGEFQLVGLRSDSGADTRQIAFVSDLVDLDLEINRSDNKRKVTGQLGMDHIPADLSVSFVRTSDDPVNDPGISTDVDVQGYFGIQLEPGVWNAVVRLHDAVVVFPDMDL